MAKVLRVVLFVCAFIFSILAMIHSVYADCDASSDAVQLTPLQGTTANCANSAPNTDDRKKCCALLYPTENDKTAFFLCIRRTKMNADEAKKLHESFTNAGPQGGGQTTDRLPIIFLPGIAGSFLSSREKQLWPLAAHGDREDLALKADGRTSARGATIEVGDILRVTVPMFERLNFYGDFLNVLVALGYQENLDLYTFPYDWRCSNNSHYRALDNKINQALQATGKQKVILIAHSMGGLISRGYVYSDDARAARVDRLITMGTPYWGAVKPYYAVANGYTFGNDTVSHELMKKLVQNYPAAYQVQPRIPFVEDSTSKQKLKLSDSNTIHYKGFKENTYEPTSTNDWYLNSDLVRMADDFYRKVGEKENPNPLPAGVKQYVIIGRNISTLGAYELKEWSLGFFDLIFPGWSKPKFVEINGKQVVLRPVATDGDGTVPVWSAETRAATKTYYISYNQESSEHTYLPKNQEVQYIVARIIKNSPPEESDFPKPQTNPEKELDDLAEFMLNSDAHLRIRDTRGRMLGFNDKGFIEENLPGTFLDIDGTEYASVAQLDRTFRVEIVGIRDGKFTLDVNIKNQGKISRFSYTEVKVKNGTVASLSITPNQVPPAPEMTVTTDGQTSRVSPTTAGTQPPTVAPGTPPPTSTNPSVPEENRGFGREMNTTYTGNTPILRYYALNNAFVDQCQGDCDKDPACAAYTYVKPGGYKAGDPPMCYLFSGTGPKVASDCCISGTRPAKAPPRVSKACDYLMTDAIYEKWTELGSGEGKLGCPISGETDCGPSVKNTTCRLIQFKKDDGGYLLQHTSGPLSGKVFDVSGCMFKLYYQLNGPKSWLGLPTSDGYVTPTGSREDFEGGYILWDSKTWACTAYRAGTAPPAQQTQADVATPPPPVISTPPPPPQQTVVPHAPNTWRFVGTQEHGLLNEGGPLPPEDGNMVFSQVSHDANGGQFLLTIHTARVWCGLGNDTESLLVKWHFNSDIRVLRPGDTIPITIQLIPQKLGNLCPYSGLWNTEIVTAWSGHGDYFPQSEKGKHWNGFTQPKHAAGRRFNFYVHRDDPSTSSGTPELVVNTGVPSATDPQYGWFAITVRGGCCLTRVNSPARGNVGNERRNHAFYYIYKFEGK